MKNLVIQEERHTPKVVLDPDSKNFEVSGKSFPEDSRQFYKQVIDWLEEYRKAKPSQVDFKFNLFYLSSSSIISIKQILLKLKEIEKEGAKVCVLWHYDSDDDDIRKTGEDYLKLTQLDFKFIANED